MAAADQAAPVGLREFRFQGGAFAAHHFTALAARLQCRSICSCSCPAQPIGAGAAMPGGTCRFGRRSGHRSINLTKSPQLPAFPGPSSDGSPTICRTSICMMPLAFSRLGDSLCGMPLGIECITAPRSLMRACSAADGRGRRLLSLRRSWLRPEPPLGWATPQYRFPWRRPRPTRPYRELSSPSSICGFPSTRHNDRPQARTASFN